MKILEAQNTRVYHLRFDVEETLVLKAIGFLPPHAAKEAQLWSSKKDILEMSQLFGIPTLEEAEQLIKEADEHFRATT